MAAPSRDGTLPERIHGHAWKATAPKSKRCRQSTRARFPSNGRLDLLSPQRRPAGENVGGREVYKLTTDQLGIILKGGGISSARFGVHIVGGCCGTTPATLESSGRGRKNTSLHRPPPVSPVTRRPPPASTSRSPLQRNPNPSLSGSATNANGSKNSRLLSPGDYDAADRNG